MMGDSAMFWRIVRRLLTANYARLFLILLALGAGAAVTSALLNLRIDAKRRLTTEFRTFGANVVVVPKDPPAGNSAGATLDERLIWPMPVVQDGKRFPTVAFLFTIANVSFVGGNRSVPAVVTGYKGEGLTDLRPAKYVELSQQVVSETEPNCEIGFRVASQLNVHPGDSISLREEDREEVCKVWAVISTGGPEDSQIFLNLAVAQRLANLSRRISLIQLSVAGTPQSINQFIATLAGKLPDADVHGIKQFTEAEERIYNRISGLLTFTVVLVLVLTSLCVMAGMSNVAIERKNDVGLMKAIGGSVRRVVNLFLAEAILMGIAAGIVGSLIGILISISLGQAVFGVAAQPRWIVYPFSVTLTVIVSIASAFPLRRLAGIRPASVFRGEE
jgi:putative ABC transport system permease protein